MDGSFRELVCGDSWPHTVCLQELSTRESHEASGVLLIEICGVGSTLSNLMISEVGHGAYNGRPAIDLP